MSKIIEYNDARIDESSQILLQILIDYGGSTDIRTLRRESDLDQASQVHYRFENHLGPDDAGLIRKDGTHEVDGQEMTVFRITDEGRRFIDLYEDDVLTAVGAAEAVESLNRMQEQLADFGERLDNVAEEVDDTIESRFSTRFTRMQNDIQYLETSIDEMEAALAGRVTVEDYGVHLDDFEELEEAVEKSLKNVEERLKVLYANQLELADALDEANLDITLYEHTEDIDEDRYDDLKESLTE